MRAEAFYLPPPTRRPDLWVAVPPAERVWRWYELKVQRRMQPPAGMLIGQRTWARIDHNRWVADCPCQSAQIVTPADPRFACPECGNGWIEVVFPEDVDAVEASVADELPHERNWWNADDPSAWNRITEPDPPEVPQ
ncbi:hypothetical protein ACIP9H_40540 [Streptomyces sp. NPDC088732]|uniref:hypothetical protein n=1 Tax=Streptomyces sp. NPDC088732 TaxID=3365879 RepID=UPI00381E6DC9